MNVKLQVPWHVINITTKPHQRLTIIPEGTQQVYHLEKPSFAPAANLGMPTPDSLQRPSWTGGFCSMPGISPDLEYFTASGCREHFQSLGTAAGTILPALPCLFCKALQQKRLWWLQMWQHDREGGQQLGQASPQLQRQPTFPANLISSFLLRNKLHLAPAYTSKHYAAASQSDGKVESAWGSGGWWQHPEEKSLHPEQRQVAMVYSPETCNWAPRCHGWAPCQRYNATTALTMYSDSFPSPKSVLVPWAHSDTPKETSPCWREGSHQLSWGVTRWHTKNKHKNPHLVVFLMTPQMYRNIKMVKRARDLRRDAEKQLYPESKLITY